MKKRVLLVLILVFALLCGCSKRANSPGDMIELLRQELALPEDDGTVISFACEYTAEPTTSQWVFEDSLLWFSFENQGLTYYRAVGCQKTSNGSYIVRNIYEPMTYTEDIVHVVWGGNDVYCVNDPNCRTVLFRFSSGGMSMNEILPGEHPYTFVHDGESSLDFLDIQGKTIPEGRSILPPKDPEPKPPAEESKPPAEKEYALAGLDLSKLAWNGGACESCYPFLYDNPDYNYLFLGESAAAKIQELDLGYVYVMDNATQSIARVLDEPVVGFLDTRNYLFHITAANTVVVTDLTGEFKLVLYDAQETLQPESLGYLGYSLYFIEGDRILKMDLKTGEVTLLIKYEGAIDADPLYGIEDEFPHLLCIKTASDDVACNLETEETAIIPETGQSGTAAFELYMEYGIWPEDSE